MSNNSQDNTMGNQQERLHFYIGYVLGIIDGEGSCQFGYKYLYKGCKVFSPKITIFNSNPFIIQMAKDSLTKLGISYYCFSVKMHGRERWPLWRIEIVGIKRIKQLTDILLSYPSGKQPRLQVLNNFCNHRLFKNRKKYTKTDEAYFLKLKELNKLYRGKSTKSSETIRSDATA